MDWIEDKKEEFVNPYNFVSFAGESPKRNNMENQDKETLSGVIECTLKTITPIFIPDTNNVKSDSGHKSYQFFSYKDNKPVIPASEIRGMIRSAFEAVTNSCMSSVDDTYPVSRTTKPKTPGLLKWDDKLKKWCLYKAKRYMLRTKGKGSDSENKNYVIEYNEYNNNEPYIQINGEKYSNGKKINFEEGKAYKKNGYEIGKTVKLIGKGDKTGYLYLGEGSKGKHHDSIFELIEEEYIDIKEDDIKRFKRVLEIYKKDSKTDNTDNTDNTGYKSYKLSETDYNPCWYEKVGSNIYISPACISKNAYKNTLYKLLGEYQPCTSKNKICEACSLFGTVNEKLVVPSRLRFTDANLKPNISDCFEKNITLQELASPKNTATEFYTVQPKGAKFWNYDFKVIDYKGRQPEYKLIDNLKLRGRKFYWHSEPFYWHSDTIQKKERNITIQPLKKDVEFTFDIYYDKLTKDELKELIWVLNIGENDGYTKCHKIGMGKPLGLGSVKITVNEIKKRKIYLDNDTIKYDNGDDKLKDKDYDKSKDLDKYINYYNTDINIKNKIDINSDPVKEFLKITDINSTKDLTVSYPLADNGKGDENSKASHQWFNANRGNPMKPEINRSLPKILDKVLTLSKFKKVDKTNNNNKNKPQKKNTKEKYKRKTI